MSLLTHDYDFKLVHNFDSHLSEVVDFDSFKAKLTPIAQRAVDLILVDLSNNYDPTNNLNALELLAFLIVHLGPIRYLEEQLEDIILSGPCAQGRCVRLYQIWSSLIE